VTDAAALDGPEVVAPVQRQLAEHAMRAMPEEELEALEARNR
jgi:hypothetical protein